MPKVIINGQQHEFQQETTILSACRSLRIEMPTLCHDERLAPSGACRLCVVEVKGWNRHATACNTKLADGMEIETHSPAVVDVRRTLLELLSQQYPQEAIKQYPEKSFHRWLREYEIELNQKASNAVAASQSGAKVFRDDTHPYIHADFSKCITCFKCVRICEELQGQFAWRVWNRGATTLIRPDSNTTLLDSSCVSCGACADTCPTGALEDKSILSMGSPTTWTRTTCPYCGVGCEMLIGSRANRIVQVKPAIDSPVNKGHLCVKGRYAFGFNESPDRSTSPMIRREGKWREVSWNEAITLIVKSLKAMRDLHGPDSVGILASARGTNEESYLAQKFARVVLGTNNVDCCARVCHAPTAAAMKTMLGTGAATNSFDNIEHAQAFLLCGTNATENHPVVGARIKQAVLRGAKLIVVDPRQIELARYADIHLALRPGTNVPLLNAIACTIVEEDLIDQAALRDRVSDWKEFQGFINAFTPERMAEICGVPAARIRSAARLYAAGKPAMCFHGLGTTEHTHGTQGVMCLVNLALLTGNFGKPGSGINPLRGQNNVQGSAHMGCEPDNLPGYVELEKARTQFEAAWRAPLPTTKGLNLMRMVDAAANGTLKGLWAIGYDVALTNPNALETVRALKSLEFVVVQDLFLNQMAEECGTVFLPAASSFERDGTFMNSERRIQRIRKVVEPPSEARPDWKIICDVARKMGHAQSFDFHSAEQVWEEVRTNWPAGRGISYNRLEEHGLQWPCPSEDHPGTRILHITSFPTGPQASLQRIEFSATPEKTSPQYPFLLVTGRTLYQFNAGTMTLRTPNAVLHSSDSLAIAPADADRLGLTNGEAVRVFSRHGETVMPISRESSVKSGELFATFHTAQAFLNRLTSSERDTTTDTPEYKVVAVRLEKMTNNRLVNAAPDQIHSCT